MSEYTFEFNARWNATQQVKAGLEELSTQLRAGARELSSALMITPEVNGADLEQMLTRLNQIGDRAIEQARVAGREIGQQLSQGLIPSESLGQRLNMVLGEALGEARAQITAFTESVDIVPGGHRAGEVLQFAQQFQDSMVRAIQVVAERLRNDIRAAVESSGLDVNAVGRFASTRAVAASQAELQTTLGTPLSLEQERARLDAQRQASPAVAATQLVSETSGLLMDARNAVRQGRAITSAEAAALRTEGEAIDYRARPQTPGLIGPTSPLVMSSEATGGAPSIYRGTGAGFEPFSPETPEQALQYARDLDNANLILQRVNAAEQELQAATEARANQLRLQENVGSRNVIPMRGGYAEFGQGGAPSFFEGSGQQIIDPARTATLQQQLWTSLERQAQVENRAYDDRIATERAAAETARNQANLTRMLSEGATKVGSAYRDNAGQYFERSGAPIGAPDAMGNVAVEDQVRMRELDAQYLNLLRRRNTQMERLNQTQADNSFSGLLNRFAGGAGGVGFDAHAGFKPEEFLGNIAGTFGVLARYGGAGIGITAAFQGISAVRQEIVDYQTALVNLNEVTQGSVRGQLDLNAAISAAAPAGIGAAQAINLGADALARYRQEIENGGNAGQIMVTSLHNIGEAAVLTGQDAKTAAEQLIDATQGFGLGSGGQSRILDAVENARKNFGGNRGQIMQAIGDAGDLAASAGIDPEQLANMVALIQARTGASGTSVASSIERTISRQGSSNFRQALSGLGIEDTGNITNEIVQMSQAWDGLSKVQRDALITQLGGARQARELLPLLEEGRQLLNANANSYAGAGAAAGQYAREQETLAGMIREIGGSLRDVAQQFGQTGIFTFLGPTAIAIRDLVSGVDELLRIFNALPAPIREVGLTLAEAALAVRVFGNAEQQAALGGVLGRVPVIGGFARRIGLPGAGGAEAEGGATAATTITGAGTTFAETVVAAARQVAVELGAAGGAAAAEGGAAAAGGEAVLAGNAAVVARMQAMVQAQMAEAAAVDATAIEEETTSEVEARAAAAATVVAALEAGGEDVQVALAAVAQLINAEAVALEEAAAAVGVSAEELSAVMGAAAVGMSMQAGEGVMATGAMVGGVTGGLAGGGIMAMLTNPITLAIGGLIAIGGITDHMNKLSDASAQAGDALQHLAANPPTAQDYITAATALRSARHDIGRAASGPFGAVAGALEDAGGQQAQLAQQANYFAQYNRQGQLTGGLAYRLQQEQSQRSSMVLSSFGPSGNDIPTGLQSMAQNGIDAATQLQAVATALGIVTANANDAATALAGQAQHPGALGLQMTAALPGAVASGVGGIDIGKLLYERDRTSTLVHDLTGEKNRPGKYYGLPGTDVQVVPANQADLTKRIDQALAGVQTGDVITDAEKQKIADAVVASYGIHGGSKKDRDAFRERVRGDVLKQLAALQSEAQQGGGPALTDNALNTLLNGDGKNQPGLLSVIQAAKPDAFDPTGGSGPGGTLQNAVNVLRNIVQRADPQGSHYPELIAAYHEQEDKLAQATISNLERLRQAADANNAGVSDAKLAKIDQNFFNREVAAAGDDTNQMISVINQMSDGQVKITRAFLANAVKVAQAGLDALRHDPELRAEVPQAAAALAAAQGALGSFDAAQAYRTGPSGSSGGLTPAEQRRLAEINAGADPANAVQTAQVAVNAAQYQVDHLKHNSTEWWNAQKALTDAQYQLSQAQHAQAQAAAQQSVYPGSQVQAAAAQLAIAKDQVAAAERGTAQWSQAQQALLQAQVAYGNAVLADQDVQRQLAGDNTDPVFRAREAVRTAQAQLTADRRRHAPADVLHRDQLAVRDDTNAREAAVFDQRMHDAQIAHDLGQMSDAAYLRFLEGQRDRLQAIQHKTRQQFEELQNVDQALKSATSAMQGQWNLGDIKIPTPYEMRRSIQAQAQGQQYQSTAVTNYNFDVNGADVGLVRRVIEQVVGQRAQVRTTTRTRKV